jgi:site-specific recombinase XerD
MQQKTGRQFQKNLKKKAKKAITVIQQYAAQHLIEQYAAQHLIQQYAAHHLIQQYAAQHLIQQYAAHHLINHGHSLGHVEDVMDIIFTTHKGEKPGYS